MQAFKDKTGRSWPIELTLGAIIRVRALAGMDLLEIVEDKKPLNLDLFGTLLGDAEKLTKVVFAIISPQAANEKIDETAFLELLSGDSLAEMANAMAESLFAFSQGRRKEILRLILEKVTEADAKATAKAMEALKSLNVDTLLANSTTNSGSSAGSLESIPADTASANST